MDNILKTYVDEKGQAIYICPHCGFEKHLNASAYKEKNKKQLKLKCKCGTAFSLQLEYRHFFRKNVYLLGRCLIEKRKVVSDVVIKDISLGGAGVEFLFAHRQFLNFVKLGDIVKLEFVLDNKNADNIVKRAVIRTIKKQAIGCEFLDEAYNQRLGFYLM